MKLDLAKSLKELDGTEVVGPDGKPMLLSLILAGTIGSSKTEDVEFFFKMGKALVLDGVLELSDAEYDKLEKFVRDSQLVTIVSGSILEEMSSQRFLEKNNK